MADPQRSTTYKNIRSELEDCATEESKQLLEVLDLGILHPRSDSIVKALRRKYGDGDHDLPLVQDPPEMPFATLPRLDDLKTKLKGAMQFLPSIEMTPPSDSAANDRKVAEELVANIDRETYKATSSLMGLPCPALDDLRARSSSDWPGTFQESKFTFDIVSCNSLQEFDYKDTHEKSVLMCGRRVWFVYPPTEHNLQVLAQYIESADETKQRMPEVDFFRKLQSGATFLQMPGETVIIPPFCSTMVFTTKTSVSATWEISIASKLPLRLKNIQLFQLQNSRLNGGKQQEDLVEYATNILSNLERVMKDAFTDFDAEETIEQIVQDWNSYKDDLRSFAEATGDDKWGERFATLLTKDMVQESEKIDRTTDLKCLLCSKTFQWYSRSRPRMREILQRHVVKAHWQTEPTPTRARKRKSTGTASNANTPTPSKRGTKEENDGV